MSPIFEPVTPQLVEHRERVLVEREVLVPLPLADHVGRARAGAARIAAHPEDDLLGERDPDLLVVDERVVVLQRLDRGGARVRVRGRGRAPSPCRSPTRRYPSGPSSGPGPKEREVDVEQDGLQHERG